MPDRPGLEKEGKEWTHLTPNPGTHPCPTATSCPLIKDTSGSSPPAEPSLGPRPQRMRTRGVSPSLVPVKIKFCPPLPAPNLAPAGRHPKQFLSPQQRRAGELTQGKRSAQLRPRPNRLQPLLLPTPAAPGGAEPANNSAQSLFFFFQDRERRR